MGPAVELGVTLVVMGRDFSQFLQSPGNIQQCAAIVIGRLPDLSLVGMGRDSVRPDQWIDSVKLGVGLVIPDELPFPLGALK